MVGGIDYAFKDTGPLDRMSRDYLVTNTRARLGMETFLVLPRGTHGCAGGFVREGFLGFAVEVAFRVFLARSAPAGLILAQISERLNVPSRGTILHDARCQLPFSVAHPP